MESKNKGEWTELYVFFKLLGEGKLYSADENMEKMEDSYLQVLKILREDVIGTKNDYLREEDVVNIYLNNVLTVTVSVAEFSAAADYLFNKIINGQGRSFEIPESENFMHSVYVQRVKDSSHKADIFLELRDSHTGFTTETGFSIKSDYSSKASLINASEATNFVYKIEGTFSDTNMDEVNSINTRSKIIDRMKYFKDNDFNLVFEGTYRDKTRKNLMRIDTSFPYIISELLKIHYETGENSVEKVINMLTEKDPLGLEDDYAYMYKFKKLLTACSLGLDLGKNWDGLEEASGGIIVVKSDGDIITYHIYNRNLFETFLIKNTKFERGSTKKHKFATVYKEDGNYYIKLNLQIRYI